MKSPAQEAIAQIMFWTGIGCFPLSIALIIVGVSSKKIKNAIISFSFGAIAFTHFLWYFNVLGGSLATKVGEYKLPAWYSFLPYSLVGFVLLIGLWIIFNSSRAKASQSPAPPKQ